MKQIGSKKYYVSIGYIEKDLIGENGEVDFRKAKHFFMKTKESTTVYVDDSDKENIITIPLIPVNDIRKVDGKFNFNVLLHPTRISFEDNKAYHKINVLGLFEEYKNDGVETVKHLVAFTTNDLGFTSLPSERVRTVTLVLEEKDILGEK